MSLALLALAALASASDAALISRRASEKAGGETLSFLEVYDDSFAPPRPGVLYFHGSLAGPNAYFEERAARLAALGYHVLAPVLVAPADVDGVEKEERLTASQMRRYNDAVDRRAEAALRLLRGRGRVRPDGVAAVGYCHLGGPGAVNLARKNREIRAAAAFYGGIDARSLPMSWARRSVKPKILVLLGGRDPETVPLMPAFADEMRASRADWRMVVYGNAMHRFPIPSANEPERGWLYDAEADRLSWRELTLFLKDALGE